MVPREQIQYVINEVTGFIVGNPGVVFAVAVAVLILFLAATRRRKKSMAALVADKINDMNARPEAYAVKPYNAGLPLPDAGDHACVRELGLTGFSARDGMTLYADGVARNDQRMAVAGLRFYAQYALDGGYSSYVSPSGEYEEISDGYLALGRTYDSYAYLTLAHSALLGAYVVACSISEPATIALERRLSAKLENLKLEVAAHPDAPPTPSE